MRSRAPDMDTSENRDGATVHHHRVLPSPPKRVCDAFADGEAVAVLRQGVPLAFISIKARLGFEL